MKTLFVLTEGQTETNFVKRVLAPYFIDFEILLVPNTIITKSDSKTGKVYKGGISYFSKIDSEIKRLSGVINKNADYFLTTMIDYYGVPVDTPGYSSLSKINSPYEKIVSLENEIYKKEKSYFSRNSFFPYLQLHEFETLIFSDLTKLSDKYFDSDVESLMSEVSSFTNPELINNGIETAPSKRILKYIPCYNKTGIGVTVTQNIGIENLCAKCIHFNDWIKKIKQL